MSVCNTTYMICTLFFASLCNRGSVYNTGLKIYMTQSLMEIHLVSLSHPLSHLLSMRSGNSKLKMLVTNRITTYSTFCCNLISSSQNQTSIP